MNELASNHAEVNTNSVESDRRLEALPERGCLAEKDMAGKKMSKTEETSRLCVEVDPHKT